MTWFTASSVTINNGETVVNVNAGDDIQIAQEAGGLIIGNNSPVEIKRTYLDGGNNQKIELRSPWPHASQTAQPAVAFPTDADLAEATRVLREVSGDTIAFSEALALVLTSTEDTITIETATQGPVTVVPYGKLTQDYEDKIANITNIAQDAAVAAVDASVAAAVDPFNIRLNDVEQALENIPEPNPIIVSNTAPVDPAPGTIWLDTSGG